MTTCFIRKVKFNSFGVVEQSLIDPKKNICEFIFYFNDLELSTFAL
jgi:hypothetical protein